MNTKKLDIHAEAYEWRKRHVDADRLVCDAHGTPIQAIYDSPYTKWAGRIGPDGCVDVPDMDHYNSLTEPEEISEAVDELGPFLKGRRVE